MKSFAGIDIGTTNTKLLVVAEDGTILKCVSKPTPKTTHDGLAFFDLKQLDQLVDSFIASVTDCISLGFSTIGETVVPVRHGKALYDAPMWNEQRITTNDAERSIIGQECPFEVTGLFQNGLLSLDKILWMRRNLPQVQEAETFLPMATYQVYRKTGCTIWEYSQACRSNMFVVHEKRWNDALLERFGMVNTCGLGEMGTYGGEKDGIIYGIGGHDHQTGLYGLYASRCNAEPFFYYSMGTSAVLSLLVQGAESQFDGKKTYNPNGSAFIPGFETNQFVLTRSFRQFGSLMAMWGKIGDKQFEELNRDIEASFSPFLAFTMTCDGDLIVGNSSNGEIDFYHFRSDATLPQLEEAVYLYLATVTSDMQADLSRFQNTGTKDFLTGGGVCKNTLFMKYLATALNHAIVFPDIAEISALGGVCVGIKACGKDKEMFPRLNKQIYTTETIEPQPALEGRIALARDAYATLKKRLQRMP